MTTTPPKFCKDCAHYFDDGRFSACRAPVRKNLDLVHGTYRDRCTLMRHETGACGPEAKLFEPTPSAVEPLIIYAPGGSGKSLASRFLAEHFGKSDFLDDCPSHKANGWPASYLIVTNSRVPEAIHLGAALIKAGQDLLQSQDQPATEVAPDS